MRTFKGQQKGLSRINGTLSYKNKQAMNESNTGYRKKEEVRRRRGIKKNTQKGLGGG
jgi:hypothetical protein